MSDYFFEPEPHDKSQAAKLTTNFVTWVNEVTVLKTLGDMTVMLRNGNGIELGNALYMFYRTDELGQSFGAFRKTPELLPDGDIRFKMGANRRTSVRALAEAAWLLLRFESSSYISPSRVRRWVTSNFYLDDHDDPSILRTWFECYEFFAANTDVAKPFWDAGILDVEYVKKCIAEDVDVELAIATKEADFV